MGFEQMIALNVFVHIALFAKTENITLSKAYWKH